MHARNAILSDIASAIALRGVTVARSRVYPTDSAKLPMFLIYGRNENVDWSGAVGAPQRSLSVTIEVLVEARDGDVDTAIGTYCEHIENALNPAGSVTGVHWSRVESTEFSWYHEGNLAIGIAELTVDVQYRTMTADASALA